MNDVTILFKNVVLKGETKDDKSSFELVSTGDVKITADPTTLSAIAKYFEEVANREV